LESVLHAIFVGRGGAMRVVTQPHITPQTKQA
jgi:hypothetical protein